MFGEIGLNCKARHHTLLLNFFFPLVLALSPAVLDLAISRYPSKPVESCSWRRVPRSESVLKQQILLHTCLLADLLAPSSLAKQSFTSWSFFGIAY